MDYPHGDRASTSADFVTIQVDDAYCNQIASIIDKQGYIYSYDRNDTLVPQSKSIVPYRESYQLPLVPWIWYLIRFAVSAYDLKKNVNMAHYVKSTSGLIWLMENDVYTNISDFWLCAVQGAWRCNHGKIRFSSVVFIRIHCYTNTQSTTKYKFLQ